MRSQPWKIGLCPKFDSANQTQSVPFDPKRFQNHWNGQICPDWDKLNLHPSFVLSLVINALIVKDPEYLKIMRLYLTPSDYTPALFEYLIFAFFYFQLFHNVLGIQIFGK